jgi:hypothetical protein
MNANHTYIKASLVAMIDAVGLKYTLYSDTTDMNDGSYFPVFGQTIKLWNVFPFSGERIDRLMLTANEFLKPYGLFLAYHVLTDKVNRLIDVRVPQTANRRDVYCKGFADTKHHTVSLLVKPLPTPITINVSYQP